MNGCRKCPAFDKCTVYEYRGSQCAALRSTYGIESDPEIITNGDRIRDMSDEELSYEILMWRCDAVARHHGMSSEFPNTQKTILEWLQQPYEGGEEDKNGTETD